MFLVTQRNLAAAFALLALTTAGCMEGYPPSAHGQQPDGTVESQHEDASSIEERPAPREYEVVATEADGSRTIQFRQQVYTLETRTRFMSYDDGQESEESYNVWIPQTQLRTVKVPAGKDIVDFLNEGCPQFLSRLDAEEVVLYEIVDREPDGTTVVRVDLLDIQEEIRTRTITRNGQTIEQCYALYEPILHEAVEICVPAGQDILATVDDFQAVMNSQPEPPTPEIKAPAAEGSVIESPDVPGA